MKTAFTLILGFLSIGFTQAQNYTFTNLSGTYADLSDTISLNNGEVWDDPEYIIPLIFPFEVNGRNITALDFSLGLGGVISGITSEIDTPEVILPFHADLIDLGYDNDISESPISYKIEGSVGNRILKLEWKNAGSYGDDSQTMYVNFQLWLYETSNIIEFHFGPSMVNIPSIFYEGETGPYLGVTTYYEISDDLGNMHFITGPIASPILSPTFSSIIGTPTDGTIYRLTPVSSASISKNSLTDAQVYPNPSKGIFNISFSNNETFQIEIIDYTGRVIRTMENIQNTAELDLTNQANGLYIVRLQDENNNVSYVKLIKQ